MLRLTLVVLNLTTGAFSLDSDSDESCFSLPAEYRTSFSNEATLGSSIPSLYSDTAAPKTHKRSASTGARINDPQLEVTSKRTGSITSEQFLAVINAVPLSRTN